MIDGENEEFIRLIINDPQEVDRWLSSIKNDKRAKHNEAIRAAFQN